jgi:two-component system response regulator
MNHKKIILLVEDNPDDAALTRRVFEKHSVANQIIEAHDGVEALDYLFGTGPHAGRDLSEQPDIVLLDLKLPKVDGLEVLRRIRQDPRTRLQPVIILTSSKEEQDLATGYRLGANSYVRKPINFTEFAEAIRQLGLFWLLFNETPPPPRT